jgi:hypothetical protein
MKESNLLKKSHFLIYSTERHCLLEFISKDTLITPSPQSPPLKGGEGITFLSPGKRGKGEGVWFYL